MKKIVSAFLLSTALLAGCSGEELESADVEACEHLQGGPSTAILATASASEAPAVSNDHRRYDITLVDGDGGKRGSVRFASPSAHEYVLFLGADVPVAVTDANGAPVNIEESAKSSPECTEVKGRHLVTLGVGTYTLTFGPTAVGSVSLVIEEEAHEH